MAVGFLVVVEVVERGQQLALHKVTGGTKDDEKMRVEHGTVRVQDEERSGGRPTRYAQPTANAWRQGYETRSAAKRSARRSTLAEKVTAPRSTSPLHDVRSPSVDRRRTDVVEGATFCAATAPVSFPTVSQVTEWSAGDPPLRSGRAARPRGRRTRCGALRAAGR